MHGWGRARLASAAALRPLLLPLRRNLHGMQPPSTQLPHQPNPPAYSRDVASMGRRSHRAASRSMRACMARLWGLGGSWGRGGGGGGHKSDCRRCQHHGATPSGREAGSCARRRKLGVGHVRAPRKPGPPPHQVLQPAPTWYCSSMRLRPTGALTRSGPPPAMPLMNCSRPKATWGRGAGGGGERVVGAAPGIRNEQGQRSEAACSSCST